MRWIRAHHFSSVCQGRQNNFISLKKIAKKNILVAEDDKVISNALSVLLKGDGYNVVSVLEGGEIITQVKKTSPDLIVLDVSMPGVNGYEICQKLKKNRILARIPIIMMSASNDIAKRSIESGANDFIAKPFDVLNLLGKIKEHLK